MEVCFYLQENVDIFVIDSKKLYIEVIFALLLHDIFMI